MPTVVVRDREKLLNVPPEQNIYLGSNSDGDLVFEGGGYGHTFWWHKTAHQIDMGPAKTLACGLTEICARNNRGKVYYFATDWDSNLKSILPDYTEMYYKMPLLLYVDFKWGNEQRDDWFKLPHWQRMELLSARNTILHQSIPVMPITLTFEQETYPNIRVPEALKGSVNLYYNRSGNTYVGFASDMARHMKWFEKGSRPQSKDANRRQGFWQGDKNDLEEFKARTGKALVETLAGCYNEKRPESTYLFKEILEMAIQAHDELVTNGGYTIEWDKDHGPRLADIVRREIRQLELREGTGTRLDRLRRSVMAWGPLDRLALENYKAAHGRGATALAWFMLKDEEWQDLDEDMKEMVIEYWELQETQDVAA